MIIKKLCIVSFIFFSFMIMGYSQNESDNLIISAIKIEGNDKTKEKIISRELTFNVGDTVRRDRLANHLKRSKENVLNLSLFNFVTVDYTEEKDNSIMILILVEERCYLWPSLIFDHADRNISTLIHEENYSKIDYGFGLKKENFRGHNETVDFTVTFGY